MTLRELKSFIRRVLPSGVRVESMGRPSNSIFSPTPRTRTPVGVRVPWEVSPTFSVVVQAVRKAEVRRSGARVQRMILC